MLSLYFSYKPYLWFQRIWRLYQYQHLYNLAQRRMRDNQRDFCFYVGLGSLKPEARGLGLRRILMPPIFEVGGQFSHNLLS